MEFFFVVISSLSLSLLRPIFSIFRSSTKSLFCFADGFIRLHADCSRLWVFRLIYENAKKHHDNSFASNNVAPAVKEREKKHKNETRWVLSVNIPFGKPIKKKRMPRALSGYLR